jgi:hypothetical protein
MEVYYVAVGSTLMLHEREDGAKYTAALYGDNHLSATIGTLRLAQDDTNKIRSNYDVLMDVLPDMIYETVLWGGFEMSPYGTEWLMKAIDNLFQGQAPNLRFETGLVEVVVRSPEGDVIYRFLDDKYDSQEYHNAYVTIIETLGIPYL